MNTSQRKAAALALPLVVLLAMVVRAEAIVAMGRSYIRKTACPRGRTAFCDILFSRTISQLDHRSD